ncbi:MAG: hypothetical protein J6K91_07265, partial [Opitutales bacterium]|nr:hypothetical protein [Opitutales bacterium]
TYKHGSAMKMKNNVAIYGGFAGTETSKDQRVEGNNTILDGENSYRVFYNYYSSSNPLTNSAKLDNVTIQNGYTSGFGAGMYNYYASPEITNCTFTNNSASSGGGGMYNSSSSSVLTNCTFYNNSASSGGGMYNYSPTSPKLTNCILWGNTASNSGNEIYNDDSNNKPTIDTCIIKGGVGYSYGTYTNIITADPKLMPLGNYGGSVLTCLVGAGSSAIGAGKVVDGLTTDARGVLRSTTAPTIGAYEYEYNASISITSNISDVEIAEGKAYTYTILAKSLVAGKTLTYNWQVNKNDGKGWVKAGSTKNTLKVSAKANMDGWKYRCVVSNGLDSVVSNVATLDVLVKAKITTQPTVSAVAKGGMLTLKACATGDKLKYQWQLKNGKVWEDIVGETLSTLTVNNMTVNNAEYRCLVSNSGSSVTTKSVKVPVISKPDPIFDTKKHYPEAIVGKKATFAIKATKPKGETGTYKYQWYKKNADGSIEEIAKATKATYTTPAFTQSQLDAFVYDPDKKAYFSEESYFCEVYVEVKKERINWNKSDSFKVMKVEEAKIAEDGDPEEQKIVVENAEVKFTAKATLASGSKVVYQWQVCAFGSDPENPKSWKNTSKGQMLTIKKATIKLSGNKYRCQVYNDLNKKTPDASNYAVLNVEGKPVVKTQPKAITSYEGLDLELIALVYGYSLDYVWEVSADGKTGWEAVDGNDSLLFLEDLDDTFFYRYTAKGANGQVSSKAAKVTVKDKVEVEGLEVLQNKLALEVEDGDIAVVQFGADVVIKVIATGDKPKYQWESSDDPTDEKSWEAIKGGTKNSYTIKKKNLPLETGKTFRCKVYNGTGKVGSDSYVGTEDYSDGITIMAE